MFKGVSSLIGLAEQVGADLAQEAGCRGYSWDCRDRPVWKQGSQGHFPQGETKVKMGKAGGSKGEEEELVRAGTT